MKVLIIVDMQKGFIKDGNKHLVSNINRLIKSEKFDKIVATKFVNKENSPYIKILDWHKMFESDKTDFAVDLSKDALIIEKTSYGLPTDKLSDKGIRLSVDLTLTANDEVCLCGTDYDACVLAIGYQLFDNGIAPKFIENAIGSSSAHPVDKEIIERVMKRNFGQDCIVSEGNL